MLLIYCEWKNVFELKKKQKSFDLKKIKIFGKQKLRLLFENSCNIVRETFSVSRMKLDNCIVRLQETHLLRE